MKRLLLMFVALLSAIGSFADGLALVDGLEYILDAIKKEATLVNNSNYSYKGNIAVPEKFTVEGVEYRVTRFDKYCFANCTDLTNITIPSSVISLGNDCFLNCSSLTNITIPSSVTSLGNECFKGCFWLTSISIPSSVTSISNDCFNNCISLRSFTIPLSVISIGDGCFYNCESITNISIPSSVTSLGDYCFAGCKGLTSITCNNPTPPGLGENAFSDYTCTLYVPDADAYKNADGWRNFKYIEEFTEPCAKPTIGYADGQLKFTDTNEIDLYRTAIPVYAIVDDYSNFYIPYYVLAAYYLLMAITYRREWKAQQAKGSVLTTYVLPLVMLCVIGGVTYHFWYKDANFHHELRMQRCIDQADWEGVVKEGTKQDEEPTRAIVMMHNLALSRLGRQCDEMYNFRKGSKKPNTPLPVYMFNVAGRSILYQYGAMNECHRVCMEEGVEYGWNVEQLKDLARCATFNKEPQAAKKFLDLLRQTSYYGDWADHMETLLNDSTLLAKDQETGPITRMMHHTDRLEAVEGYVEKSLMNALAQEDADDIYFQEQAVLAAMWTRNPEFFWPRFNHYVQLNGEENMPPRIFQEAAWLFANMQGMEGLDEWVLEPGVKERLNGFMKLLQQYKASPSPNSRAYLYNYFGNTYYFEYFFLRDITYY